MTTIAYNKGELACDSQGTSSETRFRASSKLVSTDDYVYVVTGALAWGLKFVADLEAGQAEPELRKATVLRMDLDTGQLVAFEPPGYPIPIEDAVYAEGSGFAFALGAMAQGASPEEAVKIAAKYDVNTGFGIQVVRSKAAERRLKRQRGKNA